MTNYNLDLWDRTSTQDLFPSPTSQSTWDLFNSIETVNYAKLKSQLPYLKHSNSKRYQEYKNNIYTNNNFTKNHSKENYGFWLKPWTTHFPNSIKINKDYLYRKLSNKGSSLPLSIKKLDILNLTITPTIKKVVSNWRHHVTSQMKDLDHLNLIFKSQKKSGLSNIQRISFLRKSRHLMTQFMSYDLSLKIGKESSFTILKEIWGELNLPKIDFNKLFETNKKTSPCLLNQSLSEFSSFLVHDEGKDDFLEELSLSKNLEEGLEAGRLLTDKNFTHWQELLISKANYRESLEISKPSWGECPSILAPLILNLSQISKAKEPLKSKQMSVYKNSFKNALSGIENRSLVHKVMPHVDLVETILLVESQQMEILYNFISMYKAILLESGQSLVNEAKLSHPNDVVCLNFNELSLALANKPINLELRVELQKEIMAETYHSKTAQLETNPLPSDYKISKGTPQFGGKVVGKLVFINSIDEAKDIEKDSILFVESPNSALTPIFPFLKGIVMSETQPLSQGLISSQEFTIPAISGIKFEDCFHLKGKTVMINGDTGEIKPYTKDI
jgi:phosphohistidine swiveling domain-containing protein